MSYIVESRLRVRYAETDQMGVVYYSNYLVWMEIGRTDFCLKCGFRYRDLEVEAGVAIAVAEARIRYRSPARYDDEVLVRTRLERLRRRAMTFSYEITKAIDRTMLVEATTTHMVITKDGRPRSLPDSYFELLSACESKSSSEAPP